MRIVSSCIFARFFFAVTLICLSQPISRDIHRLDRNSGIPILVYVLLLSINRLGNGVVLEAVPGFVSRVTVILLPDMTGALCLLEDIVDILDVLLNLTLAAFPKLQRCISRARRRELLARTDIPAS